MADVPPPVGPEGASVVLRDDLAVLDTGSILVRPPGIDRAVHRLGHHPPHGVPAGGRIAPMSAAPRFLTLADVAEVLNTSSAQVYALVRRGDLPAIKIGGRGQWRVEASELEGFIQRMYAETRQFVDEHPFVDADSSTD
jgi:excisionase family DNA binding protein